MTIKTGIGASVVQRALEENSHGSVPDSLRIVAPAERSTPLSPSDYTSRDVHDAEVERLWKRTWQWACRERDIPNVGDYVLYEIASIELIVVRASQHEIKAFPNSCLHRGSALQSARSGNVTGFRCSFHGWCYDLDGTVEAVPAAWDFPSVCVGEDRLPAVQVETWDGWVFVNMDPKAQPFREYAGVLPEHFTRWPFAERTKMAHVEKVVPCNWKVVQGQFLESYHGPIVHPQFARSNGNYESQYDYFPPNVVRMLAPGAVANDYTGPDVSEQQLADMFAEAWGMEPFPLAPGQSARSACAARIREQTGAQLGIDLTAVSDAELLDALAYYLFPNFSVWGGFIFGLAYRWRPYGDDPNMSLMDIMVLSPPGALTLSGNSASGPDAIPRRIAADESLAEAAPELGGYAAAFDQDLRNSHLIQRGLNSSLSRQLITGQYQEANLRAFKARLQDFIGPVA